MAYLLGRREFWSLEFAVSPAVLVPRPETELLVQRLLQLVTAPAARVADLGTGSGAIAIALAHERPDWLVTGTDVSPDALAVARENGARLAGGRVEWALGDWYARARRAPFRRARQQSALYRRRMTRCSRRMACATNRAAH